MKKLVLRMLQWKAKKIIAKYKPTIVAVTGSVGKTSTRNAIAAVLGEKFRLRTNIENYNNEFGIPFTIIGVESPGKSVWGWLKVFAQADRLIVKQQEYPNLLVLEYGIDRPGDMAVLCGIAAPNVAVLTAISPVHVENFGSIEKLTEEKAAIFSFVKEEGRAIVSADDDRVMNASRHLAAPVTSYGISAAADVRGQDYRLETRKDFSFDPGEVFSEIHFHVEASGEEVDVSLSNLVGEVQVSAALAALAVGRHFGLSLEEMAARLWKEFKPQAGRMRPIPGIKGCLLLDDSYNAAPASMKAALRVLSQFAPSEGDRRIAVLGKMAELGSYSEQEHLMIGQEVVKAGVKLLVTVGEPARDIRRGALSAGMLEEKMEHFGTSEEAGRYLDFHVKQGDVVLVKGSQSARMEKVVKDLMAEPQKATELLVRQYGAWLKT